MEKKGEWEVRVDPIESGNREQESGNRTAEEREKKKAKRVGRGRQKTRGSEEEGGNGERRGAKETANLSSVKTGPLSQHEALPRICPKV